MRKKNIIQIIVCLFFVLILLISVIFFIFFGRTISDDGFNLSNSSASFIGEDEGDKSGISVAIAGDVNGDGYDDILIGAWQDEEGGEEAGQTYLIFGKETEWEIDTDLSSASASFIGEGKWDLTGVSVAGAGDVNGDGYDDILIGAINDHQRHPGNGKVYLILGKETGWAMDTNLSNSSASFWSEDGGDHSVYYVKGAGDVNGDGLDDFLIGNPMDDLVHEDGGQTFLFFGKASGWALDTNLSNASASFLGENNDDRSGGSISGAGDVNGDGFNDILIGARNNDDGGPDSGKSYLIFGKEIGWEMGTSLAESDATFLGEDPYDGSGRSISGAGDVNGDGYDDILIGASCDDDKGDQSGQVYLIFGKEKGWSINTNLVNSNASYICRKSYNYLGRLLASVGDIDGDGYDDFLISGSVNVGPTYLIKGKSSGWDMDSDITKTEVSFSGGVDAISGAGDVNGDGFDDILIGNGSNGEGGKYAGQTYLIFYNDLIGS